MYSSTQCHNTLTRLSTQGSLCSVLIAKKVICGSYSKSTKLRLARETVAGAKLRVHRNAKPRRQCSRGLKQNRTLVFHSIRFHSGADSHLHNPLLLTCHTEPIALLGTNNRRRVTIRVAVVVAVATIARADRIPSSSPPPQVVHRATYFRTASVFTSCKALSPFILLDSTLLLIMHRNL